MRTINAVKGPTHYYDAPATLWIALAVVLATWMLS